MTTSDTVIAAYGPPTVRAFHASHVAATLCCFVVLLVPALWNHYPLLQYDTGGYLARWYEGYLVPSRSTVFGLFLHVGEGLHFWPELILQTGCAILIIGYILYITFYDVQDLPWRQQREKPTPELKFPPNSNPPPAPAR